MMRGDSFSNTPSSALNRTLYSRAEFEQRKAAIIEVSCFLMKDYEVVMNRSASRTRPIACNRKRGEIEQILFS